ncbi:MAG: dihydropteroate synthase [Proteobacteria bacterium]|nr:dihydropteroate synthase [Pseudomonadota bacterium]
MGAVNVTPDSFSDGGRFFDPARAVAHGLELAAQGADLLDVGGESTRPGAEPVAVAEEIGRVVPVIEGLKAAGVPISIDTLKPEVARAAVAAGATIWNDVTSLSAPGSLETAAELGCGVVLMHMQGEPRTMQQAPRYDDVLGEVEAYLLARAEAAISAGVRRDGVWIDPGIGFGKTLAHNLALLRSLDRLAGHGFPLVLGVSRKSFLKAIDAEAAEASDRLGGSLAAALWGARQGAAVLRVHDVRETRQALATWAAIEGEGR